MSHFKLTTFIISAALFASSAVYAGSDNIITIPGKISTHKVYVAPEELSVFIGHYQLETGDQLIINRVQNRLYAQIGTQHKMEIIATQENNFSAKKENVQFQFSNDSNGITSAVNISYPTKSIVASR